MKIKIKKLNEKARLPQYAKKGDAGMDLYCTEAEYTTTVVTYKTGLSMEIPEGHRAPIP